MRNLPRILALLDEGHLDERRATLITRRLHLASEERPEFEPGCAAWLLMEAMIAAQAPALTYLQLERLIDRFLLELEPDGDNASHNQAMRSRRVRVEAQPDGMALVTAVLSAEAGQLLDGFLDTAVGIDHMKPYAQGGVSCVCNMHPACRGHHRLKTFGGWEARPARPDEPYPPGTIVWTTPDGSDHGSLPGMPGWSLPVLAPAALVAETQSRVDRMSSTERSGCRPYRGRRMLPGARGRNGSANTGNRRSE